jgi:hypothetical protein
MRRPSRGSFNVMPGRSSCCEPHITGRARRFAKVHRLAGQGSWSLAPAGRIRAAGGSGRPRGQHRSPAGWPATLGRAELRLGQERSPRVTARATGKPRTRGGAALALACRQVPAPAFPLRFAEVFLGPHANRTRGACRVVPGFRSWAWAARPHSWCALSKLMPRQLLPAADMSQHTPWAATGPG